MATSSLLSTAREEKYRRTKYAAQQPLQLFDQTSLECERVDFLFLEAMKKASNSRRSMKPLFVLTPPMKKKSVPTTPKAPSKLRKCFPKTGLKIQPRKLSYAENQQDNEYNRVTDGKYDLNKSPILSTNRIVNRKELMRSRGKTASTAPTNRSLKMSDNENWKRDRERSERKMQQSTKKNDSVSLSHSSQKKSSNLVKDLHRFPSTLSVYNDTENWQDKLLWLQPRRDVGVIIQCCHDNCRKWRYCDDYHDPTYVPEIWYCEMNSDKTIASCHATEVPIPEEVQEDLIENKYNAGSIVWARVNNYPWWPAIVDDCPNTYRYYQLREPSIIPIKYHVTFLEDNLEHAWLGLRYIKAFVNNQALVQNTVFHGKDYKEPLKQACILAQSALRLSIFQRLRKFSYVSRSMNISGLQEIQDNYTTMNTSGLQETQDNDITMFLDDDEDEIIPGTPPGICKRNYMREFRKVAKFHK